MVRAPQSLCESHEQPASLLEQPSLLEKVNIQILSPNRDRVNEFVLLYLCTKLVFISDASSFLW
jgi:hypothetical protein